MITKGLPPVHPGEFLYEILEDLNLQTWYDLKIAQTEWQDSLTNVREITHA